MLLGERKQYAVENNGMRPHDLVVEEKDQWVQHLRIAIAKQTADDLRTAIRTHADGKVKALCNWFRSEWGQLLCFGQGELIVQRIIKEEEEREQENA